MQPQPMELAARTERVVADALIVGGGQSGLAAADAAQRAGLRPVVLEAGGEPVGSWPHYYDSLRLFSPARFSALPGRPFTELDGQGVRWSDGTREPVDAVILATGYRPGLDYLAAVGALDGEDRPLHRRGISTTVPGLGYVGLPHQRRIASATLRGAGPDAEHVITGLLGVARPARGPRRTAVPESARARSLALPTACCS